MLRANLRTILFALAAVVMGLAGGWTLAGVMLSGDPSSSDEPIAVARPTVGAGADEAAPQAPAPAAKAESARPAPAEGAPAPPTAKAPAGVAPTKSARGKSGKRRAPASEDDDEQ